jgi:antiviral helicase SKI2
MSVESMIKRSFSEFATQRAIGKNEYPKLLMKGVKTLAKLDEEFKKDVLEHPGHEDVEKYYFDCMELLDVNRLILTMLVTAGGSGGGVLCPGRLLLVTSARRKGLARSIAVLLKSPVNTSGPGTGKSLICLVLLPTSYIPTAEVTIQPKEIDYVGYSKRRHYIIKEIDFGEILIVTDTKIKIDPNEFYDDSAGVKRLTGQGDSVFASATARNRSYESTFLQQGNKKGSPCPDTESHENVISMLIQAEMKEAKDGLGVVDFKDALKLLHHGQQALDAKDACNHLYHLLSAVRQYHCHKENDLVKRFATIERRETLRAAVKKLRHLLSHESLQLFPDFMQRKSVLHSLGYIDENDTVCIKGRVACEVNTCEELIVTELVFGGLLNNLSPAELAAVLSALVFQEKTNEDELSSDLPQNILDTCELMKEIATKLGATQKSHGLNIDPNEYCDNSLKFGLVHVVYEWAMGVPFSNICELTTVQEGSIVRCITRLDELCREVRSCARVVGNPTLYRKTEEACTAIKRDIVFVASLYVN